MPEIAQVFTGYAADGRNRIFLLADGQYGTGIKGTAFIDFGPVDKAVVGDVLRCPSPNVMIKLSSSDSLALVPTAINVDSYTVFIIAPAFTDR